MEGHKNGKGINGARSSKQAILKLDEDNIDRNKFNVAYTKEPGKFNGFTKTEIMNMEVSCLNVYQKVCKPRVKIANSPGSPKNSSLNREAFDAFLEMCK